MKIALRQLRAGAAMTTFADEMVMEMRIAARIVVSHDFSRGRARGDHRQGQCARAGIRRRWRASPTRLLDTIFAPLPADQEWSPLP